MNKFQDARLKVPTCEHLKKLNTLSKQNAHGTHYHPSLIENYCFTGTALFERNKTYSAIIFNWILVAFELPLSVGD